MKAILAGYGEVGQAVFKLASKQHIIRVVDPALGYELDPEAGETCDVLLIAMKWSGIFSDAVNKYQVTTMPAATIIFSTVPIGTCDILGASHFPVEGQHPNIADDLVRNEHNWLGGPTETAVRFLTECGLRYRIVPKASWTEFLKLRSLAYFGLCVEFARYGGRVANKIGMPEEFMRLYDTTYNELLVKQKRSLLQRPVLNPPIGPIGGHCVLPGIEILNEQYPEPLLVRVLERSFAL